MSNRDKSSKNLLSIPDSGRRHISHISLSRTIFVGPLRRVTLLQFCHYVVGQLAVTRRRTTGVGYPHELSHTSCMALAIWNFVEWALHNFASWVHSWHHP
jgi:hypothetical protein